MTIYTKTGDEGYTHRPDGQRVRKDHPMVAAVGAVDELNAHLGLCLAEAGRSGANEITEAVKPLQAELFATGALLALGTPRNPAAPPAVKAARMEVDAAAIGRMERQIDAAWGAMPALSHFILPGGCELACRLHAARTVCRRAERAVVAAADAGEPVQPVMLQHLNRLSDLLFALARKANHDAGVAEIVWSS